MVGFFVLGAVLGFLFNVLKVAVIIGIVILAVAAACRLFAGAERCRR